jgi:hypothetical protein
MTDTMTEEKATLPKAEWAERIAAQQRSGISVKQFCKEHGLTEYSFYAWRKRLQKKEPVRFALVDRGAARQVTTMEVALELVLATGADPIAQRDYYALRAHSGIALVTRQSGKSKRVVMRRPAWPVNSNFANFLLLLLPDGKSNSY